MTTVVTASNGPSGFLKERYRKALLEYITNGGEQNLGTAYEMGRAAMNEGVGLLEFTSIHHQAVLELSNTRLRPESISLLSAAADFLAESLSPYEMSQRGFREAVIASRQLNETLEKEIKRIAYSVHDEASQLLATVHIALADAARNQPRPQKAKLAWVKKLLDEIETQLRRYSHELRPTILDDLGLLPAIRFLAESLSKRSEVSILVHGDHSRRMPEASEIGLYRVVQEALTNALKHARARRILIDVRAQSKALNVSVIDDGIGFDPEDSQAGSVRKGLGLISMKERLTAIGGTLSISSSRGRGTKLLISLPINVEVTDANSSASG